MNDSQYTTRLKERESFEIIYFYGLLPIEQSNLHEPFFSLSLSDAVSSNSENGISLDYVIPESLFFLLLCMHVYDLSSSCSSLLHPSSTPKTQLDFLSGIKGRKERNWMRKVFFLLLLCCGLEARNKWKSLLFEEVYVNNPDLCILSAKIWGNKKHNKSISAKCHNL